MSLNDFARRKTIEVNVGGTPLGGSNPIRVQTMTTTNTNDTIATAEQCIRAFEAGAEYVRITTQGVKEASNLENIKKELIKRGYNIPLVADIHFNPSAAIEAAKHVDKVRINPGNFVDSRAKFENVNYTNEEYAVELAKIEEKLIPLISLCKERGVVMRIGVNHGSLSDRIMSRYGDTPDGMVESALEFLRICRKLKFDDIVISMKSSNTRVMVYAVRLLINRMDAEGMHYPLHLGVTEAGDGEDGRIKSAVGIGTLLADGIGDTIRVSLTEEPEYEIPVAKKLVEYYNNRKSNPAIEDIKELPYNPFEYNRRETISAGNIGANNPPIVIANISNQTIFNEKTLNNWGWFLNTQSNRWERKDVAADYFFVGDTQIETSINAEQLPIIQSSSIISIESLKQGVNKNYQLIKLDYSDLNNTANIELLKKINATIILSTNNSNGFAEQRAAFIKLIENGIKLPVIVHREYSDDDKENLQLKSASDFGALLIDGLGDGVMLTAPKISDSDICSTAFTILQAARTRISKTEYISCPGCGRTLFNLQQTLQKVKSTTAQLKGLKIGVMGCIVNGPGEMADADYGYVGAGPGRITLYKGKEVVKKNIPEENAIEELINVIKENGDWKE
ncbi:MAG TPA: (E)-4-hydroxy-3-methylbut-2-enyl-diphosphate synthase [Tenuifilaceae bacterium]|nr:(E)-4-hydroxy-3-methylbut-2-enyl-diphosphate synthase [Tenuifilaceae bacterium]HPI44382.1 (E)-4-hydroxy-3-methylbut-2-enyl-diphosphate synthase [Tenuifilaceae bacterium]